MVQPEYKGMQQLTNEDLQRLARDPHNLVYTQSETPVVPDEQRIRGEDMRELVQRLRSDFLVEFQVQKELNDALAPQGVAKTSDGFAVVPDGAELNPSEDRYLDAKQLRSKVRRMLCARDVRLQDFWKVHPRVFCKATNASTTDEQFDLLLKMFDIIANEERGEYASKEATDNIIQQMLMGVLAKPGSLSTSSLLDSA